MGALRRRHGEVMEKTAACEGLFHLLSTLPEGEASDILRRIRTGSDPATVYNQVTVGDALLQMAVAPETRFRYEFPYLSEMPFELTVDNPYMDSLIYEATSLFPESRRELSGIPNPIRSNQLPCGSQSFLENYEGPYLKPFHASRVVEPLLVDVKPSAWTAVCKDDALMRRLLASLLHCEYFFASIFQKVYFLEDMAAGRRDFCSPLLVNAVLAYACVRT